MKHGGKYKDASYEAKLPGENVPDHGNVEDARGKRGSHMGSMKKHPKPKKMRGQGGEMAY